MLATIQHKPVKSLQPLKRYFSLDGRNRLSTQFIPQTKNTSHVNSTESHAMLIQGGFVRPSGGPGIFSLLPLGLRTVEKIEHIIDEEMQAIGSQKLSLPLLLNPEGWKKTGRWDGAKGEFFRLKDRKESDLLLAPTHEEEITSLVASELKSSKQLPIRLYQIGRKYRDELRPRAGLLRGREFIMKDLYSFDTTVENAYKTYDDVAMAYKNIFTRIGVPFVVAEADSGNIGGSKSHEYHLISSVGEDTLLTCGSCGYTANEELALGKLADNQMESNEKASDSITMSVLKDIPIESAIQSILVTYKGLNYAEDGSVEGFAAVFTPFGRQVNLLKAQTTLSKYLKSKQILSEIANLDMDIIPQEKLNSMKPEDVSHLHLFLDNGLKLPSIKNNNQKLTVHKPDHFRLAKEGDHCATCQETSVLTSVKAIECGHTFYLGTKYSSALDCTYREGNSLEKPAEMGCYGIGVTRILAAVAEAKFDNKGIAWPTALAPYRICIVPTDDRKQEFKEVANQIYDKLNKVYKGDILIDDRRSGFGAKMKDTELIGYPFTIIVGQKAIDENRVEINQRVQGDESIKSLISLDELHNLL